MAVKRVLRFTQLLAAGVLVGGLANASQITVTASIPSFVTDNTETASLPFFQSAPGFIAGDVLTGVQIEFNALQTVTALTITNEATIPETFTFVASGNVSAAGNAPGSSSIPTISKTFTSTTVTLPGGGILTPIPPPVSISFDSGLVSESISPYDTTGTFTLGFTTLNSFDFIGGGGNLDDMEHTLADGTVTVIYTIAPRGIVPEPASVFTVGLVLLFAGSRLRKHVRNRA